MTLCVCSVWLHQRYDVKVMTSIVQNEHDDGTANCKVGSSDFVADVLSSARCRY
jgi:hypothetical protein